MDVTMMRVSYSSQDIATCLQRIMVNGNSVRYAHLLNYRLFCPRCNMLLLTPPLPPPLPPSSWLWGGLPPRWRHTGFPGKVYRPQSAGRRYRWRSAIGLGSFERWPFALRPNGFFRIPGRHRPPHATKTKPPFKRPTFPRCPRIYIVLCENQIVARNPQEFPTGLLRDLGKCD